jgi:hypothetical protein
MPRFEVRVSTLPAGRTEQAIGLLVRRYPEIDLVDRRPDDTGGEVWRCEAPAAAHLHRWLAETGLSATVTHDHHVHDEETT